MEVSRVCGLEDWLLNAKYIGVFDFTFSCQDIRVTHEFGGIEIELGLESFLRLLREDKNFAESSDKRLKREADASRFGKKDHVSL